ncbi:hypothetical protein C8R46DRAFT_1224051 [Mycena filopes]|nr:hypothetical protein C8R46DRAFT_1224051 [Mycena filopes]
MSAQVVLRIPELCDHVSTHLGSSTDLKTCALLTKTFTFAAQRHLFGSTTSSSIQTAERCTICIRAVQQHHRWERSAPAGEATLEQLATARFLNLNEVVFYARFDGALEKSALAAMRSIIGLPTMRRVALLLAMFSNTDDFRHIFQLKPHLEFLRCYMLQVKEPKLTVRTPTTTIKELQIGVHGRDALINTTTMKELQIGVHGRDALINSFDFSRLEKLGLMDASTQLGRLHDLARSVAALPLEALLRLDIYLGQIFGKDKDEILQEVESAFSIFPASVKVSVTPWTAARQVVS